MKQLVPFLITGMLILPCFGVETVDFPPQKDIQLEIHGVDRPANGVYYFAPHQDEHVINRYLIKKVKRRGEKFIILKQAGTRHIILRLEGQEIELDPNRMFTPKGVAKSIRRLNPGLDANAAIFDLAVNRGVKLGMFVIARMNQLKDKHQTIVAIHNNTEGYDNDGKGGIGTVSIHRYKSHLDRGLKYLADVNISTRHDEDDLYFVTLRSDFEYLKKRNFNLVYQNPDVKIIPDEDDGSLSVFAEMKGVRYFNVEAQRDPDHFRRQKKMVKALFKLLDQ